MVMVRQTGGDDDL